MKKNVLNSHVFELTESLEKNLSYYTNDKKPEYLHLLRLDIKKIRAVLYFAQKIYNEKFDASKLKPLFQNAGIIREIQINISLLTSVPGHPEELLPILKNKENILNQEFIENESSYHKLIKDFRDHLSLPEMLPSKKKIIKYFKKEKRKANKMLHNTDSEGLHEYRIKIKKILYVYEALPEKLQDRIELNRSKISKQQKKLGKWHDTYAAINFLSHDDFSTHASEFLLQLKEKEKRQFKTLLERL